MRSSGVGKYAYGMERYLHEIGKAVNAFISSGSCQVSSTHTYDDNNKGEKGKGEEGEGGWRSGVECRDIHKRD